MTVWLYDAAPGMRVQHGDWLMLDATRITRRTSGVRCIVTGNTATLVPSRTRDLVIVAVSRRPFKVGLPRIGEPGVWLHPDRNEFLFDASADGADVCIMRPNPAYPPIRFRRDGEVLAVTRDGEVIQTAGWPVATADGRCDRCGRHIAPLGSAEAYCECVRWRRADRTYVPVAEREWA